MKSKELYSIKKNNNKSKILIRITVYIDIKGKKRFEYIWEDFNEWFDQNFFMKYQGNDLTIKEVKDFIVQKNSIDEKVQNYI